MRAFLLLAVVASPATSARGDEGSVVLFNGKDLSGWTTYVPHADKSDPKSDPRGVFTARDGLIHVSGEEFGCLTTTKEFENYRLLVEFKWGEKRYPPREKEKRDSGILVHCTGPDKVWTQSIECQIQEGDCGDFWLVSGTEITVDGTREKTMRKKSRDAEKPFGEWNTVEVICDGSTITNIINGQVVNKGTDASVSRGRILLQSEGAEIFFRKVELRPL